jgi:hypothetical protein
MLGLGAIAHSSIAISKCNSVNVLCFKKLAAFTCSTLRPDCSLNSEFWASEASTANKIIRLKLVELVEHVAEISHEKSGPEKNETRG